METQTSSGIKRRFRIIPRLDIKGPNVIKGVHLECLKIIGNPETLAEKYYLEGADELIYMDVVASLYERNNLLDIIHQASKHIFIPLTVGGGIRSIEDIKNILRAGADKVAINTWAVKHPEFMNKASETFGSQCIIGSIEAKKIHENYWEAYTENGREPSSLNAVLWAKELEKLGAGELLITSIDKEGTEQGYDFELIKTVAQEVSIPIIASGGAGSFNDIKKIIEESRADAVAIASLFHYQKVSVSEIKTHKYE
jgi:cyclase